MSIKVVKRTERPLGRARDGTGEPQGSSEENVYFFPAEENFGIEPATMLIRFGCQKSRGAGELPGVTPGPETRRGAVRDPRRAGLARIERAYGYWRLT